MTLEEVGEILRNVEYSNWDFRAGDMGDGFFVQAVFNTRDTEHPEVVYKAAGRKWYISSFAIADEVVKTCWLAVEVALRHEALELFKYKGAAIFHPHTNVEVLKEVQEEPHVKRIPA